MLDKQYSRVIRWINRAQTMSANGNFSDAILDVECARAELDDAREALLMCHKAGKESQSLFYPAALIFSVVFSVFYFVAPVGKGLVQHKLPSVAVVKQAVEKTEEVQILKSAAATEISRESHPVPEKQNIFAKKEFSITDNPIRVSKKISEKDMRRLLEVGRKALHPKGNSVVLEFH